jgi:hypothetical protein
VRSLEFASVTSDFLLRGMLNWPLNNRRRIAPVVFGGPICEGSRVFHPVVLRAGGILGPLPGVDHNSVLPNVLVGHLNRLVDRRQVSHQLVHGYCPSVFPAEPFAYCDRVLSRIVPL